MHQDSGDLGSFRRLSQQLLATLHRELGFSLWMVTRVHDDDWVVLTAEDHGYDVADGSLFRWADSFCSRMVRGLGPRIAPDAAEVPAYADAPIGQQVPIGSYVGVPLRSPGGGLFGTLCAIDPRPAEPGIVEALPMLEMNAAMLAAVLGADLRADEAARRAERAEAAAMTDELTGLYNRRGWWNLVAREEARSVRYGSPAAVAVIDLDELKDVNDRAGHAAGDQLLRVAAGTLRASVRRDDVCARLGGDEFAVLAVADEVIVDELAARLTDRLASNGVRASVGVAPRHPKSGLAAAVEAADERMYRVKQVRRAQRHLRAG